MIKIEQPFNNNVVMGWDRKHGEVVIVGKGIGFHWNDYPRNQWFRG